MYLIIPEKNRLNRIRSIKPYLLASTFIISQLENKEEEEDILFPKSINIKVIEVKIIKTPILS